MTERNPQANKDFEGVIDPPLSTGEGAYHHNTQRKPASEEPPQSELLDRLNKIELAPSQAMQKQVSVCAGGERGTERITHVANSGSFGIVEE